MFTLLPVSVLVVFLVIFIIFLLLQCITEFKKCELKNLNVGAEKGDLTQ